LRAPASSARTVPAAPVEATTLVLVRHGESVCNVAGVVGGPRGCTGLSERGMSEARALRDRLVETRELSRASALYSSVLERAVQTAAIISAGIGGGLEPVTDCSLCELHPGEADGLTWEQFSERYGEPDFDSDPYSELAPGGESWAGFVHRASDALRLLAERHSGECVVVVCHAGVVEASLLELMPVDPRRGRLGLRTGHTSLTEWELSAGGWRLLRYNDVAHLAALV